jgi:hypothetical protein
MPLLAANYPTLLDVAKRMDPDGKIAGIAELLNQTNEVLQDAPAYEGNLTTGHRTTVRTGLPAVYWRLMNMGIPSSKSTTAQVDEGCGMLEAYSQVDKALAELNGNVNAFRLSEAKPFIEAMNQEVVQTMFYGNSSLAQEEFNGLAVRYSSLSAGSGSNVISGSGSGSDNSSIWLIGWGEQSIHLIFPKGTKAGLTHEDLGQQTSENTNGVAGNLSQVLREHYKWLVGIALKDWRYVVRICNIDISNLIAKSSAADLPELMIKATYRIPFLNMCRPVFYMNRTCFQMLDIQRRDDVAAGGQLSYEVVDGKRIAMFRGIPVKIVDQLLETEATVS